jgi:hypothetical protein
LCGAMGGGRGWGWGRYSTVFNEAFRNAVRKETVLV